MHLVLAICGTGNRRLVLAEATAGADVGTNKVLY